jgi:tetrahedral aminopeptidase
MIERIRILSEAYGPSGAEESIRTVIQNELSALPVTTRIDELGNLIVTKKGVDSNAKPILLTASMDENGIMVIDRDDNGFLRVGAVGNTQASDWVGQRVVFENGTVGVVQAEKAAEGKDVTFAQLFIDLGDHKGIQRSIVDIGDVAVLHASCISLAESRLTGKALANRAGCAVVIELLHILKDSADPIVAIFSTQHQVGSRGIKPAVFPIDPSVAISFGALPASDTPAFKHQHAALGRGPVIMLKERNFIVSSSLRDSIKQTARTHELPFQLGLSADLVTNAGNVAVSKAGVRALSIAVPVRDPNTANERIDTRDIAHTVQLVQHWIEDQR